MSDMKKTEKNGSDGILDPERRGSFTVMDGRRMSRIGPPPNASNEAAKHASTDEGFEVNQLIEMEADNAIKYRTCSWQKVGFGISYWYNFERKSICKSSDAGISF